MQNKAFTVNNFDLIRLFAAFQVALHHSVEYLIRDPSDWLLLKITVLFPGVPIFFFISGFLISKSYENSLSLLNYAQNRILRIYPALIICVTVSILSVWLLGYYQTIDVNISDIMIWFLAQISIVQCYNPTFMRAYGVGTLDGSLWTIGVELQFYVLIPILYGLIGLKNEKKKNIILIVLIAAFMIFNRLYIGLEQAYSNKIVYKLIGISFIPWFYMFLTGVFVQRNFDLISRFLENRATIMLLLYCSWVLLMYKVFHLSLGNGVSPFIFMLLAPTIFSVAFSKRDLCARLLNKNDVSYGVYIYHMPVVNALLYMSISGIQSLALALICTFFISAVSWFVIEKPSLMWKKHPLNPLRVVSNS
jgi:peptidoglycan/LPS O-acetylase OafA/YrhL